MKIKLITGVTAITMLLISCKKEELKIKDVSFTSDKTSVAVNQEVTFTIGDGANAVSIYTGDNRRDFEKRQVQ